MTPLNSVQQVESLRARPGLPWPDHVWLGLHLCTGRVREALAGARIFYLFFEKKQTEI